MREWLKREKRRLVAGLIFLAVSLGLFFCVNLDWSSPPVRVAKGYMKAAIGNDYMALYRLFDPSVLEGEMARNGLDRAGLERVAQTNADRVKRHIADVESTYAVKARFAYAVTGVEALTPEQLEQLTLAYDADGLSIDLQDGRQVTVRATATLTGAAGRAALERDLVLTVLQTPRGWSLDRDSMYAYWDLLYALPNFAWDNFS